MTGCLAELGRKLADRWLALLILHRLPCSPPGVTSARGCCRTGRAARLPPAGYAGPLAWTGNVSAAPLLWLCLAVLAFCNLGPAGLRHRDIG